MNQEAIVRCLTERGAFEYVDAALESAALAADVHPGVALRHFALVRYPDQYFRQFDPQQIAEHLRMIVKLADGGPVVSRLRALGGASARGGDGELELLVVGLDLMGVTACVAGCLAELSLSIDRLSIATSEDANDSSAASPFRGRHSIISVHVAGADASPDVPALDDAIRTRLEAAYWHLVRGDLDGARQGVADTDNLMGEVVEDRFRVDRFLCRGGMGAVYLGHQLDLQRQVALKFLRPDLSNDEGFVERFQREALLLANVQSPGVIQVYASGSHKGRCWIALEYMPGGDIGRWSQQNGAPSTDLAMRWLRESLTGLRAIHTGAGLIHGDVKPANLLLDATLRVRLGDFGLGQQRRWNRESDTDGVVRGTPFYMSPEQARGEQIDHRSDLFSLGSTFYHLLSGAPPYDGGTRAEIVHRVARGEHIPLSVASPQTPGPLAVIVERLMQPLPLRRYQDAGVAVADLDSYLDSSGLLPAEAFERSSLVNVASATPSRMTIQQTV